MGAAGTDPAPDPAPAAPAGPTGLRIRPAGAADLGEIWTVQRAAYLDEAHAHGDPYIAPLTETLAQVRAHLDAGLPLLAAVLGARVVGTVRGRSTGPTFLVNRLAVAPDQRGRGIGRALLADLERRVAAAFPDAATLALVTGQAGEGGLRLYRSLGYAETHRERIADHLTMVHLRKPVPGRAAAPAAP
jgi:ribosomal protein S18 acetylase RimI-like enzyme